MHAPRRAVEAGAAQERSVYHQFRPALRTVRRRINLRTWRQSSCERAAICVRPPLQVGLLGPAEGLFHLGNHIAATHNAHLVADAHTEPFDLTGVV